MQAGALAALDDELILTQDLRRVCALPTGYVEEALASILHPGQVTAAPVSRTRRIA